MESIGQQQRPLIIKMKIKNKAQASLELSAAIIVLLLLFVASLRIFIWLNKTMVQRQGSYERNSTTGRIAAGSANSEVQVDETQYKKLDLKL